MATAITVPIGALLFGAFFFGGMLGFIIGACIAGAGLNAEIDELKAEIKERAAGGA